MKYLTTRFNGFKALLAAVALISTSTAAHAVNYTFSYTFGDGSSMWGNATGTHTGTDLSDMVTLESMEFLGDFSDLGVVNPTALLGGGAATAAFNGSSMNILGIKPGDGVFLFSTQIQLALAVLFDPFSLSYDSPINESWVLNGPSAFKIEVASLTPARVPDGGSTLLLSVLGLGTLLIASRRMLTQNS